MPGMSGIAGAVDGSEATLAAACEGIVARIRSAINGAGWARIAANQSAHTLVISRAQRERCTLNILHAGSANVHATGAV